MPMEFPLASRAREVAMSFTSIFLGSLKSKHLISSDVCIDTGLCVFYAEILHSPLKHRIFLNSQPSMVKDNETVVECVVFDPDHDAALTQIRECNMLVNMTAGELEKWLREEQ